MKFIVCIIMLTSEELSYGNEGAKFKPRNSDIQCPTDRIVSDVEEPQKTYNMRSNILDMELIEPGITMVLFSLFYCIYSFASTNSLWAQTASRVVRLVSAPSKTDANKTLLAEYHNNLSIITVTFSVARRI